MSRRNIILLIVGSVVVLSGILFYFLLSQKSVQNPQLIINQSDINSFRVNNDGVIVYSTKQGQIGIVRKDKPASLQSNITNHVQLSPSGKYYSVASENSIKIYTSLDNLLVQTIIAQQFSWQLGDGFVYLQRASATQDPQNSIDSDTLPYNIVYVSLPGSAGQTIGQRPVLTVFQYSPESKITTLLTPNMKGNFLQEGILTQLSPASSKEYANFSSYQQFLFPTATVLNDTTAGSYILTLSSLEKYDNFRPGDTLGLYNNQLSDFKIQQDKNRITLVISEVSTKKSIQNTIYLPDYFSNTAITNPYIVNHQLYFLTSTGIFSVGSPL